MTASATNKAGRAVVKIGDAEEWTTAELALSETELHVKVQGTNEISVWLTTDHYVGDSSLRENCFLLSDVIDTIYVCVDTPQAKRLWMLGIASALRRLGTRKAMFAASEHAHGPAQGAPQNPQEIPLEEELPNPARARLEEAERALQVASRLLEVCTSLRQDSEFRASKATADAAKRSASAERERVAKLRAEREAEITRRRMEEAERERERERKLLQGQKELAEQQASMRKVREERAMQEAKANEELIQQKKEQEKRHSMPKSVEIAFQSPTVSAEAVRPGSIVAGSPAPVTTVTSSPQQQTSPSEKKSSILSKVKHWNDKANDLQAKQEENPFSGRSISSSGKPLQSDEGYGKAKPGSKTEERAIAAQKWVEVEVDKLCGEIAKIGTADGSGKITVTFGKLFVHYESISDTLVGIMMRAKKRLRIDYKGDMLFQSKDDHVPIYLLLRPEHT